MDDLQRFNLAVRKVRGKDEFEMYKNYIHDLPIERIPIALHIIFEMTQLKEKSDAKAICFRNKGNNAYNLKDYNESLGFYTKSLCYANYNSEAYAVALANRSAVYFALQDYKSCIDNINLCIEAKYPYYLKPKVYIRKAKCYQKLGEASDMRNTLVDLLNYLDSGIMLHFTIKAKYKKMVKELLTAPVEEKPDPEDKYDVLPPMKQNPTFLNASDSVMLKYNKLKGCHVVAKQEIVRGDVLFVEKAYTFAPTCCDPQQHGKIYCQYCLLEICSSIPCKTCVKYLYCNEKCRESAWKEFHQWECIGVQAGFFKIIGGHHLALRIILKAVLNGISTKTINFENLITYGNRENNYPFVYNLPSVFNKIEKTELMGEVAIAALLVNYLKSKTEFFEWMKRLPAYANKSNKELMNRLGGLLVRHGAQLRLCNVPADVFDNEAFPNVISIAGAICPSLSMMKHSCVSNTTYYFVGDTIVVKASKNIKINEEVSFKLFGVFFSALNKDHRQELLQKFHYADCNCQMCSNPQMDIHKPYICINCNGSAPALESKHPFASKQCVCLDCNYKFTLPADINMKEKLVYALLIRFIQFNTIDDANRCLQISKTIFRPNHSFFEELYSGLLDYYNDRGEVECFIKIGKTIVDYVEIKYCYTTHSGLIISMVCEMSIKILQKTAMNIKNLREVLQDLTDLLEKAKIIFQLEFPSFTKRLQKVEKSISELRILHTLQIANRNLPNHF